MPNESTNPPHLLASTKAWIKLFFQAANKPLMLIFIACMLYITGLFLDSMIRTPENQAIFEKIVYISCQLIVIFSIYWFFVRLINVISSHLIQAPTISSNRSLVIVLPFITSALKVIALLALINLLLPFLGLPPQYDFFLDKLTSILIICSITWIIYRLIQACEQLILNYYEVKTASNLMARKIYTQMHVLRRILVGLIFILAVGAILMLFENVRGLGTSVLASAGIAGLILSLAAQRSLPSVFAGLQIAINQPIKIDDAVMVENEFGYIEQITFQYVVVKLWDWRRLVLPTTYFLEKPFQNWSRQQSTNLIGTIYLYVDYTLPLEELRAELLKILKDSPLWDEQVHSIQVSDSKERSMELRVLASARSPGDAWNLRCEVREKLIDFIAKNYPHALPRDRQVVEIT